MVQLETKHFPLVLFDLGGSARTPDEFRAAFPQFHEVNRRSKAEGNRWALVAVTDSPPNAIERKIIAEESNRFSAEDLRLCVASVLVIPNGIIRSVVTALSWLIPNMAPVVPAATSAAAVDVAIERLRAIGVDVPLTEVAAAKRWLLREPVPGLRAGGGGRGTR